MNQIDPSQVPQAQAQAAAPTVHELAQSAVQAQDVPKVSTEELMARPIAIKIELPTQAYFVSGIRDFTLHFTQNLTGFSEQWAFRFQAVVDELCNNAIEHGSAPGEKLIITFNSIKGESFEVSVEDTGTAKEKMSAAQLTALYQERKQLMTKQYLGFRGRGLPKIVGEWTDDVIFEDAEGGGIIVKVKKYLRKEEDVVSSTPQTNPTHLILK